MVRGAAGRRQLRPSGESVYLCEPPPTHLQRCRYAGHLASVSAGSRGITVLYYVDPLTRRFYAQPHPNSPAAAERDWGVQRAPQRPLAEARTFARATFGAWKGDEETLRAWWAEYAGWRKDQFPPPPLDIPGDPASAYGSSGWTSFKDWLLTPRKPKKSKPGKPKKQGKTERARKKVGVTG